MVMNINFLFYFFFVINNKSCNKNSNDKYFYNGDDESTIKITNNLGRVNASDSDDNTAEGNIIRISDLVEQFFRLLNNLNTKNNIFYTLRYFFSVREKTSSFFL